MDVRYINLFLDAVKTTLEQFGVNGFKKNNVEKKECMYVNTEINSVIGVTGNLEGRITYSMSEDTAKKIVSIMMMGMPVNEIDDMGKSAIGELSNMITGQAGVLLSQNGYNINITTPAIHVTDTNKYIIDNLATIAVKLICSIGVIEINIGLH